MTAFQVQDFDQLQQQKDRNYHLRVVGGCPRVVMSVGMALSYNTPQTKWTRPSLSWLRKENTLCHGHSTWEAEPGMTAFRNPPVCFCYNRCPVLYRRRNDWWSPQKDFMPKAQQRHPEKFTCCGEGGCVNYSDLCIFICQSHRAFSKGFCLL